jgi:hypothetical protein
MSLIRREIYFEDTGNKLFKIMFGTEREREGEKISKRVALRASLSWFFTGNQVKKERTVALEPYLKI